MVPPLNVDVRSHFVLKKSKISRSRKTRERKERERERKERERKERSSAEESSSSFHLHLNRILSNEEINQIVKGNSKFEWIASAVGVEGGYWRGSGVFNISSRPNLQNDIKCQWKKVSHLLGSKGKHSLKQETLYTYCASYRDILYMHKRPFHVGGYDEDTSLISSYLLHILNHLFRTQENVGKNNTELVTCPKVLVLLPSVTSMYRVVKIILKLIPRCNEVVHVDKCEEFYKQFGLEESKSRDEIDALFGADGNDNFIIGIKVARGEIKLMSKHCDSDILIASPQHIAKLITGCKKKDEAVSYLSNVEILVVDHADVIAMKNWSDVDTTIKHLNFLSMKHPKTNTSSRPWYLKGHARFYRQTIILGFYSLPGIQNTFNQRCFNYEGKVELKCKSTGLNNWFMQLHTLETGLKESFIPRWFCKIVQCFERFTVKDGVTNDRARFDYFANMVFPRVENSGWGGILIFASTNSELEQIKDHLSRRHASFCVVGEEDIHKDTSNAKFRLYSETTHFYRRAKIEGVKNIIMYSLPERKEFYIDILKMVAEAQNRACNVLYSHHDKSKLKRIVGSHMGNTILGASDPIFPFAK